MSKGKMIFGADWVECIVVSCLYDQHKSQFSTNIFITLFLLAPIIEQEAWKSKYILTKLHEYILIMFRANITFYCSALKGFFFVLWLFPLIDLSITNDCERVCASFPNKILPLYINNKMDYDARAHIFDLFFWSITINF